MEKEFEFKDSMLEKEVSLEKTASKYYANIPFHNFDHVKDTLKYAEGIMKECEKTGIAINKEVVRKALLFHDAGYHENKRAKGFDTKEEYSVSINEYELKKEGYSPEFIKDVNMAIMATQKDGKFSTNEQKLARMSDISNMAGEYEKFLDCNLRLKNEIKYMSNKKFSWTEWKKATKDTMEFYMSQDEAMAIINDRDEKGKTSFCNGIKQNMGRFLSENEDVLQKAQEEFEKNFYSENNGSQVFTQKPAT